VIAQCLAAAQRTVPHNFTVHSMHCYFVLAGDSEIPVMYYVEHVREGKSFATRTVQARQRGKCIFTTTMSFVRENSGGKKLVQHAVPIPQNLRMPVEETVSEEGKCKIDRRKSVCESTDRDFERGVKQSA
jgi:acyl-CoA thioesterase 8